MPSFFPSSPSSSTPTHGPSWNCTLPTKRTVPPASPCPGTRTRTPTLRGMVVRLPEAEAVARSFIRLRHETCSSMAPLSFAQPIVSESMNEAGSPPPTMTWRCRRRDSKPSLMSPHLGEVPRAPARAVLGCAGQLRRKSIFYYILPSLTRPDRAQRRVVWREGGRLGGSNRAAVTALGGGAILDLTLPLKGARRSPSPESVTSE